MEMSERLRMTTERVLADQARARERFTVANMHGAQQETKPPSLMERMAETERRQAAKEEYAKAVFIPANVSDWQQRRNQQGTK